MTSSLAFLRQSAEATERQARTLEESLIETRKAADAAKASADFLKLTERAFVLLDESRSPDPREKAEMIYWIVNCGKTPAYIKVVKAWMEFTDSGLPPPVHTLANVSYKHVGEMAVLGPSQTFDAGVDLPGSKTLECQQIEATPSGRAIGTLSKKTFRRASSGFRVNPAITTPNSRASNAKIPACRNQNGSLHARCRVSDSPHFDREEIDSAQVLDWILHSSTRACGDGCTTHLVEALDQVVDSIQSKLCPKGASRSVRTDQVWKDLGERFDRDKRIN